MSGDIGAITSMAAGTSHSLAVADGQVWASGTRNGRRRTIRELITID